MAKRARIFNNGTWLGEVMELKTLEDFLAIERKGVYINSNLLEDICNRIIALEKLVHSLGE